MPQAIAAAFTAIISYGTAAWAAAGTAWTLQSAIGLGLKFVASSLVSQGIAKLTSRNSGSNAAGADNTLANLAVRMDNSRATAQPRNTIYGEVRYGGSVPFFEVSGDKNEYLHIVLVQANHEVNSFGALRFNGEEVPLTGSATSKSASSGTYAGYVNVYDHFGTDTQTVDTVLSAAMGSKWGSDKRGRGIAYTHYRLKRDQENPVFLQGIPNITRDIQGKKVFDPRLSGGAGGYAYSNNWALCLADFIVTRKKIDYTKVDLVALTAAANRCDENVTISGSTTEKRYTMNGVVYDDERTSDVIQRMLLAADGFAEEINGKWVIHAGGWRTPVLSVNESHFFVSAAISPTPPINESVNQAKALFASRAHNYQVVESPPYVNSTYVSRDNGKKKLSLLKLDYTVTSSAAQRLCKIVVEKANQSIRIEATLAISVFEAQLGDNILVSLASEGFVDKPFEIERFRPVYLDDENGNPFLVVEVSLKETASTLWDWDLGEEVVEDPEPNTTLPSPWTVEAPTFGTLASNTPHLLKKGGTVISRLYVPFTFPDDSSVMSCEFEYIRTSDIGSEDWTRLSPIAATSNHIYIPDVEDGVEYTVRARGINALGRKSSYTTSSSHEIVGKTENPSAPTGLTATALVEGVKLTWNANSEADLKDYAIYVSTSSGSSPSEPQFYTTANEVVISDLTADIPYYFGIRARDTSLNVSSQVWSVTATPEARSVATGEGAVSVLAAGYRFASKYDGTLVESVDNGDTTIQVFVGSSAKSYNASPSNDSWRVGTITEFYCTRDTGLAYPNIGISAISADSAYLDVEVIYRNASGDDITVALRIQYTKNKSGPPTVQASGYSFALPASSGGTVTDFSNAKWTPTVTFGGSVRTYSASPTNDRWRYGTITPSNVTQDTGLTAPEIGISAISANSGRLTAGIIYRDSEGVDHETLVIGTFTKAREGATGPLGKTRVWVYKADSTGIPDTPSGNGTPSGWLPERGASGQIWWQSSSIQFEDGTIHTGWSTPVRVPGNVTFSSIDKSTIPSSILLIGDVAYDSTDLNNPYVWDGSAWDANGLVSLTVSKLTSGNLTSASINMVGSSVIRSGQTAFDTGAGYWLGIDGGTPKFSIGNGSDQSLTWNGSSLAIKGTISGSSVLNIENANGKLIYDTDSEALKVQRKTGGVPGMFTQLQPDGIRHFWSNGNNRFGLTFTGLFKYDSSENLLQSMILSDPNNITFGVESSTGAVQAALIGKDSSNHGGIGVFRLDSDVQLVWGFTGDTNLYRSAANELKTDDNLTIGLGTLKIGADTNLYRSAANTLKTDDTLHVAAGLYTNVLYDLDNSSYFLNPSSSGTSLNVAGTIVAGTAVSGANLDTIAKLLIQNQEATLQLMASDGGSAGAKITLSNETKHWQINNQPSTNALDFRYGTTSANGDVFTSTSTKFQMGTDGNFWIGSNRLTLTGSGFEVNGVLRMALTKPTVTDASTNHQSIIANYYDNDSGALYGEWDDVCNAMNDIGTKLNSVLSYLNL